jgi:hypothetical protein
MGEYDARGQDAFLSEYGFGQSRRRYVVVADRPPKWATAPAVNWKAPQCCDPPREKPIPYYEVCGEPAAIDTYTWHRTHYFCEAHRAEADIVFEK